MQVEDIFGEMGNLMGRYVLGLTGLQEGREGRKMYIMM